MAIFEVGALLSSCFKVFCLFYSFWKAENISDNIYLETYSQRHLSWRPVAYDIKLPEIIQHKNKTEIEHLTTTTRMLRGKLLY